MEIAIIIIGLVLALAGLVGCILPMLPGPVLSFISLVILSFARDWEVFSRQFFVVMFIILVVVLLTDFYMPAVSSRFYGAGRWGLIGSVIGLIIGIFVFPPWGIIFGSFAGAVVGEMLTGKERKAALRAGWGAFLGNVMGVGIQFAYACVVLFYYIKEMV